MIDVAAGISRGDQLEPERSDHPPLPVRRGEGALAVLPLGPHDRQAVDLELDPSAENGVCDPPARVDGGQGDRLGSGDVGEPQPLERPAGDRDVAVDGDPLEIGDRAQTIVARDVVAAHERPVGRVAAREGHAPIGAEDEPAAALDIAADSLVLAQGRGGEGIELEARAIGKIAVDLERADREELAILRLEHRQDAGEDVRGHREVAVGREADVIGDAELEPVAAAVANLGDEESAPSRPLAAVGVRQAGQADDRNAEKVESRALVGDSVAHRIVGHPDGVDLPGRVLRTAVRRDHCAGRVGRAVERRVAVDPPRLCRREPPAVGEHQQHVLHDAVLQRVLELDAVGISGVAFGADDANVAIGAHLAASAVPADAVRAQAVALAGHPHLARRGDRVARLFIDELVGAEGDLGRLLDSRWGQVERWGRRWRRLVLRVESLPQRLAGRAGQQQRQRGPADRLKSLHKNAALPRATAQPIAPDAAPCNGT